MYFDQTHSQLPDPVRQREFYDSVALKRGLAWLIDTVIVAGLVLVAL